MKSSFDTSIFLTHPAATSLLVGLLLASLTLPLRRCGAPG
jgi:hypothetical protein